MSPLSVFLLADQHVQHQKSVVCVSSEDFIVRVTDQREERAQYPVLGSIDTTDRLFHRYISFN